jgi:methyl-accepting chemotaxis protein
MSSTSRRLAALLGVALAPLGIGLLAVSVWPGSVGLTVGLTGGAIAVGLGVGLWSLVARRQERRLRALARALQGLAEPGVDPAPVRGELLAALQGALDKVRGRQQALAQGLHAQAARAQAGAGSLTRLAKQVNVSAGEISRSMEEFNQGAGLQRQLVEQVSVLLAEMARSIERASRSAEDAARSSAEASAVAQSGGQMASKAVDKMRGVFEQIERYAQRVFEFGERSKEIGNIVRVITEVAQQTHLLAINATIEAVRAGEAGRGFAVVAEEIRHLAENTSRSSERIARIVEEVVAGSQDAVQAVQASNRQLSEGREELASILDALRAIVTSVTDGSDRVQIINRLAREQIAGAEQTVKAFDNITALAQKNATATAGALRAAEAQSDTLLEMTQQTAHLAQLAASLEAEAARQAQVGPAHPAGKESA